MIYKFTTFRMKIQLFKRFYYLSSSQQLSFYWNAPSTPSPISHILNVYYIIGGYNHKLTGESRDTNLFLPTN